ncbi:hypothetical protein SAY87_008625 [Trapa incisa]|uniref:Uncharacterized protein n=1 Tax=Trapa incisa TaxID=236973 RepID=A0AAN7K0G1_9MYRT|nr:hypothetical protein SAY87_008625 [Trapa incisa]
METLFQYQKLRPEQGLHDYDQQCRKPGFKPVLLRSSRWFWARLRRVHARRRMRLRVPGLRRFLRRKARLVAAAIRKAVRKMKDGHGHLGDLLSGNYLFLQVSPSTLVAVTRRPADHISQPLPT